MNEIEYSLSLFIHFATLYDKWKVACLKWDVLFGWTSQGIDNSVRIFSPGVEVTCWKSGYMAAVPQNFSPQSTTLNNEFRGVSQFTQANCTIVTWSGPQPLALIFQIFIHKSPHNLTRYSLYKWKWQDKGKLFKQSPIFVEHKLSVLIGTSFDEKLDCRLYA